MRSGIAYSLYPTPGLPLVPGSLEREVGQLPLPDWMARQLGLPDDATLAALDATLWDTHPRGALRQAAAHVEEAVRSLMSQLKASSEPLVGAGTLLEELHIGSRPRNVLIRAGYGSGFDRDLTVGDLARLPAIGALSLLDIATAVEEASEQPAHAEAPTAAGPRPSKTVAEVSRQLARRRWAARIGHDDPRLGAFLRALHPDAASAQELPHVLAAVAFTPGQARSKAAQLRKFDATVERLKRLSLPEELDQFTSLLGRTESGAAMLRARLGFDTGAAATLQEAGNATGVTRERVRQVEKRFKDAVQLGHGAWTPALDRVLSASAESLPATPERLQQDLAEAGVIPPGFPVAGVFRAAEAFGKPLGLGLSHDRETGLIGHPDARISPKAVTTVARRLVEHWGATTINEVSAQLDAQGTPSAGDDLIRLMVSHLEGFSWLDAESDWFWLRTPRNRLLNQIAKIMSVAGQIDIGELREGAGRHHRMHGFRPPRKVLASLCVQSGHYTQDGDRICGSHSLPDWRQLLGENERTLAEVLFEHGPVMRRDELEALAVDERGLNRSSFYVYLGYSPILARYAPSVYGLRGAPVSAGRIRALIPPRVRRQVLRDHGWTPEGQVWIAYQISPSTSASGVLGVPGPLHPVLTGSYQLSADNGDPVGTLTVGSGGSMWGVSPFFRRRGVEAGDYVALQIDLNAKTATISSGSEELLLRYQEGE